MLQVFARVLPRAGVGVGMCAARWRGPFSGLEKRSFTILIGLYHKNM